MSYSLSDALGLTPNKTMMALLKLKLLKIHLMNMRMHLEAMKSGLMPLI